MQISEKEYNELFGESSDEEEFKGFATDDEQDEQDEHVPTHIFIFRTRRLCIMVESGGVDSGGFW